MENRSSVSDFLLLEFSAVRELQILHFVLFLLLYLAIVLGNLLIISAVIFDHHLHSPMYFFLMNLAIQDLGSVSAIIPKSMGNSFMNTRHISYSGCVVQLFCFVFLVGSYFFLFTLMAYDWYVAICNPLQYEMVMNREVCIQMVFGVWLTGLFYGAMHTGGTFAISFCSNVVNPFYCEIPQLLKLSCSNSYLAEVVVLVISAIIELECFVFIIITYVLIFTTIMRIPSVQGRKKVFATCLSYLTVFSIFRFTGWFAYLKPLSITPFDLDLALTMIYTFFPLLPNMLIYSMRNRDIKIAIAKLLLSTSCSLQIHFTFIM